GIYVNADNNGLYQNKTLYNILHGVEIDGNADSTIVGDASTALYHGGNTSNFNLGDGFNNDGTNTSFVNNKAAGNNSDCTNDNDGGGDENGTLGTVSDNTCADGNVFLFDSL